MTLSPAPAASLPLDNKGDPIVISDTKGEDITPQNPEIVKQVPVDTTNQTVVVKVENTEPSTGAAKGPENDIPMDK